MTATALSAQRLQNPLVASLDLPGQKIVVRQRLLQCKQMLFAPISVQALRHGGLVRLEPPMTQLGQHLGVTLPRHDRPQNRHPALARQIAHHLRQLQIHLRQRFLEVQQRARLVAHLGLPLPHEGSQPAHAVRGTKGAFEQAVAHQLPYPLAVQHIGLASRDLPGRS